MKKVTFAIFAPVIAGLAASVLLYLPDYFHLPAEWVKFVAAIPTVATMATGGTIFSGQRMTAKDKRQQVLIEHYKRINENVFKPWSAAVASLAPSSLIFR